MRSDEGGAVEWMRRFLLALAMVGTATFLLELALIEHTESVWQWAPIVALALGLLGEVAVIARPRPATLRALRLVMAAFVALGAVGVYLHLRGNVLFELEMEPDASGLGLLWTAAGGGVPTLAPAGLGGLGLVGWIYTFRHPALEDEEDQTKPPGTEVNG